MINSIKIKINSIAIGLERYYKEKGTPVKIYWDLDFTRYSDPDLILVYNLSQPIDTTEENIISFWKEALEDVSQDLYISLVPKPEFLLTGGENIE